MSSTNVFMTRTRAALTQELERRQQEPREAAAAVYWQVASDLAENKEPTHTDEELADAVQALGYKAKELKDDVKLLLRVRRPMRDLVAEHNEKIENNRADADRLWTILEKKKEELESLEAEHRGLSWGASNLSAITGNVVQAQRKNEANRFDDAEKLEQRGYRGDLGPFMPQPKPTPPRARYQALALVFVGDPGQAVLRQPGEVFEMFEREVGPNLRRVAPETPIGLPDEPPIDNIALAYPGVKVVQEETPRALKLAPEDESRTLKEVEESNLRRAESAAGQDPLERMED